ncbi:MAG: type II toxin-antitoxin system VapC family toxin [Myxococcota bacterium]
MIHLDTHVAIWLFTDGGSRLPARVRKKLDANRLLISPVVEMEAQILHEIKRISYPGHVIVNHLVERTGALLQDSSFARVVGYASTLSWTRDPFDRMLVAHAKADDVPLLTKDETILRNFPLATWDD